jgi:hypothetical protein
MAYDFTKLEKDIRFYLGNLTQDKLPESAIFHFADLHDSNPAYTSKHAHLVWKTTLSSLDYLMAGTAVSANSSKFTRKEKVGDVEVSETQDNSSSGSPIATYKLLYDDYKANPEKFGILATATAGSAGSSTGAVILTGTNRPNLSLGKSSLSLSRGTTAYSY